MTVAVIFLSVQFTLSYKLRLQSLADILSPMFNKYLKNFINFLTLLSIIMQKPSTIVKRLS